MLVDILTDWKQESFKVFMRIYNIIFLQNLLIINISQQVNEKKIKEILINEIIPLTIEIPGQEGITNNNLCVEERWLGAHTLNAPQHSCSTFVLF